MPERIIESADHWLRFPLVTRALTAALDAAEIVDIVVRQGMAGLQAEAGMLSLVGPEGVVVPVVSVGYSHRSMAAVSGLTIERETPLGAAARSGEPVWVTSREDAERRFPDLIGMISSSSQAWAAIPLTFGGKTFAVLGVSFGTPRSFTASECLFICALADLGTLALTGCHDHGTVRSVHVVKTPGHEDSPGAATLCRLDNAINQVYAASLAAASLKEHRYDDVDLVERLDDVVGGLDVAIQECRVAVLSIEI